MAELQALLAGATGIEPACQEILAGFPPHLLQLPEDRSGTSVAALGVQAGDSLTVNRAAAAQLPPAAAHAAGPAAGGADFDHDHFNVAGMVSCSSCTMHVHACSLGHLRDAACACVCQSGCACAAPSTHAHALHLPGSSSTSRPNNLFLPLQSEDEQLARALALSMEEHSGNGAAAAPPPQQPQEQPSPRSAAAAAAAARAPPPGSLPARPVEPPLQQQPKPRPASPVRSHLAAAAPRGVATLGSAAHTNGGAQPGPAPTAVALPGGSGAVARRIIASDNSCLFNAVGYVMERSRARAPTLRRLIAQVGAAAGVCATMHHAAGVAACSLCASKLLLCLEFADCPAFAEAPARCSAANTLPPSFPASWQPSQLTQNPSPPDPTPAPPCTT